MRSRVVLRLHQHALRAATAAGCACAMPAVLGASAAITATARAETVAALTPLLSPDRPGARSTLSLTIGFTSSSAGVPAPVRRSTLRFPAGFTLEVPHLSSCAAARLQARGAGGCPKDAVLGRGHALVEAQVGSQTISEGISLWVFLGPLRNIQPTVEILGQGYTPFDERVAITGTMVPASGPYGEALTLTIPPIPTLPLEPEASIVAFSLVIGASTRGANTVRLPARCPAGGFPFAGEFAYADGSSSSSLATVPCP